MLYHLRTNHRENPVGIDGVPEFSWMWESKQQTVLQVSYRIVVRSAETVVWDTGTVSSDKQSFVPYEGDALQSNTSYLWTLTVTDNHGESDTAQASFETGLFMEADWKAVWIEAQFERPSVEQPPFWALKPPVWFEKTVELKAPVKRARLYATAHGIYRAHVNGERVSDAEFAPEHTVYDKVLYVQTYPAEHLLMPGENRLSFEVADGWYHCPQTRQDMREWSDHPGVLFQLNIEYEDGSSESFGSDGTETCHTGCVEYADLYIGEKQDLTKTDVEDHPVVCSGCTLKNLVPQPMDPVRAIETLPAKRITHSPKGEWIVDFGQNVCGRAQVYAALPKGAELLLEYFEETDLKGNYKNTFFAPQKEIYVSDGAERTYESKYTFHGFRYLKVTGLDEPKEEDFTAVVLTSVKENVGQFECSDARLNRLYQNIRWSQTNNMLSIPTDCPTREKGGFTGDIQIYAKAALYNEDMTAFLTGWLKNLSAAQGENGAVPITVPETAPYKNLTIANAKEFGDEAPVGVAGWGDAAVIVPWTMYQVTGNKKILEEQYDTMARWCSYVVKTAAARRGDPSLPNEVDKYLWNTGFHFGEWLIPSEDPNMSHREACEGSSYYTAPIFGYISLSTMADAADALHRPEADGYRATAEKMKWAIQQALVRNGKLTSDHMGAYVLMIAFELVPEDCKERFANTLIEMLEKNGGRLDTGFLATPYLLDTFTKIGRKDLAVSLLWQTEMPSWLYEVEQGATTIWESWDAKAPGKEPNVTSYDHYAFGCVDTWILEQVVGLQPVKPGFRHFTVRPEPELFPLEYCRRKYRSEYGYIDIFWTRTRLEVTVPCGTTADIWWNGNVYSVGSGKYRF